MRPEDDGWTPTGAQRLEPRGLLRRFVVLQVQECRRAYRPIYSGHTPANWVTQTRWRDATVAEAYSLYPRIQDEPRSPARPPNAGSGASRPTN